MTLATGVDVFLGNQLLVLPLCCDVSNTKPDARRIVWDAWESTAPRCGKWGALHRAHIPIKAHPLDQPLAEYRRPAELELRARPGPTPGSVEQYWADPETDVEPIDPVRRKNGKATIT
jgi:hypothetical protein